MQKSRVFWLIIFSWLNTILCFTSNLHKVAWRAQNRIKKKADSCRLSNCATPSCCCVLTRCISNSPPPGPGHEGVVENVQEGDLTMLFPQHKEDLRERQDWLVKARVYRPEVCWASGWSERLTVSMSSIILENQNSQATWTIWWDKTIICEQVPGYQIIVHYRFTEG